jgi:hypothetical protein
VSILRWLTNHQVTIPPPKDNVDVVAVVGALARGGASGDEIHWFSILNSLFVTCFLAGLVFVIMLRTVVGRCNLNSVHP